MLFTDSELCALHRLRDLVLPRLVTDSDTDDVRLDVAALRGLAAREMLAFDVGDGVWFSPALDSLLGPCARPRLVAEVEIERSGEVTRHAVVDSVVFSERPWGLVSVEPYADRPGTALERLTELGQIVAEGNHCLTVGSRDYLRADDLLGSGSPDAAVDVLVSAGASLPAAHAWLGAVTGRHTSVLVNVARSVGADGSFLAVELGWLVAGDGTAWQITSTEDPADWDEPQPSATTTVRQVSAGVLRDAIADVCETPAAGVPG